MYFFGGRALFGVSALSLGIWSFSAPLMAPKVYSGSIVSEHISLRAADSGIVAWSFDDRRPVRAGQAVASIARPAAAQGGLAERMNTLRSLSDSLGRSAEELVRSRVEFLDQKLAAAKMEASILELDLQEAARRHRQAEGLARRGVSSAEDASTKAVNEQRLALQLELKRNAIAQAETELTAARHGSFISEGYNDVPYSLQRKLDVDLRIAEIAGQAGDAGGAAQIVSPVNGILERLEAVNGQAIAKGDELARFYDCDRLSVAVTMTSKELSDLSEHHLATLSFTGSADFFRADIIKAVAAHPVGGPSGAGEQQQLSLRISSPELARRCPIGQQVSVSFDTHSLDQDRWYDRLYAMVSGSPGHLSDPADAVMAASRELSADNAFTR
jgi:multidrug resistance efflux pump